MADFRDFVMYGVAALADNIGLCALSSSVLRAAHSECSTVTALFNNNVILKTTVKTGQNDFRAILFSTFS